MFCAIYFTRWIVFGYAVLVGKFELLLTLIVIQSDTICLVIIINIRRSANFLTNTA